LVSLLYLEEVPDLHKLVLCAGLSVGYEIVPDLLAGVPAVEVHLVSAHVEHVHPGEQVEKVLPKENRVNKREEIFYIPS
jgi:hypothetical protein